MPSPYIVSLVTPKNNLTRNIPKSVLTHKNVAIKKREPTKVKKSILPRDDQRTKKRQENKINQKRVEDRISELQGKKKVGEIDHSRVADRISELEAKKRVERIVRLRSIISIAGKDEQDNKQIATTNTNTVSSKGTLFDNYYLRITGKIWQEWIYPDLGEKNLETIIFVKIMKDGAITVQGIEKSSGNLLFDRSALKAIAKATPVTPPPYEMEIGIRFYP
jgi:colicin import membrane protein